MRDLKAKNTLNGKTFKDLEDNPNFSHEKRILLNSDIRCTVISNYSSNDILYDIFYRLNTGSVPLSSQELRQVLNKGPFADFLYDITKEQLKIHEIMGLSEPDPRLYDIEFILRYISFNLFGKDYKGNLKKFLDESMNIINANWEDYKVKVEAILSKVNYAIDNLKLIFDENEIGRRFTKRGYFRKYNKIILEMQLYFFSELDKEILKKTKNSVFKKRYEQLCLNNSEFIESISGSTKDLDKYKNRYNFFKIALNDVYGLKIEKIIV